MAEQFDERFRLQASRVEGVPYYAILPDGRSISGRFGADGLMPRIATLRADNLVIYWGDDALVMMVGAGQ